jgi:hypothetical protein
MLPLKCASVHSLQYWYCEVAQLLQCMWHIPHCVRYGADDVTVQKYSEESEDRRQALLQVISCSHAKWQHKFK